MWILCDRRAVAGTAVGIVDSSIWKMKYSFVLDGDHVNRSIQTSETMPGSCNNCIAQVSRHKFGWTAKRAVSPGQTSLVSHNKPGKSRLRNLLSCCCGEPERKLPIRAGTQVGSAAGRRLIFAGSNSNNHKVLATTSEETPQIVHTWE